MTTEDTEITRKEMDVNKTFKILAIDGGGFREGAMRILYLTCQVMEMFRSRRCVDCHD